MPDRLRRRLTGGLLVALASRVAVAGAYEDYFRALANDDAATVSQLLRRGFDANTVDERGQPGLTIAMRDGSLKVAEVLIVHPQLEIDRANAAGETALMMAALKGHVDWSRRLLERGARLDRPGWTPLHYAATGPEARLVALLLDRGASVDPLSPNGSTPLMMAARYGTEESVQVLLSRGADGRVRNERQMNAADFARSAGRDALADRLERAVR